ncbi:bifunctional 3-(3-hydroxy-phenyl)propionate/3-hydroxycinnamic acid hydroxylase [Diaphorobacter sp. HDW4A]|uniref:bifunctional 3-(3-hydroxy-phenyl)propionate/3-hydroxycinnamic acid hydroxylase MhpA n=1 Tax=Diaphorobacter sp. HDW4A TaxID=2714924 RepID=UPI00140A7DE6|nr:bifunctional 3-(3-hydroxy-phenyl)propionate/3-hydroxycinnamic acid hydroxylase [Diaphorobacter sp. HDW4A]QIL79424.1 bifunctional 3-(3-hydroxy-phenyl)propionate/3-hydroxycinnamic acid hydroxylase [Diaphorobacter sp. HDW4A]
MNAKPSLPLSDRYDVAVIGLGPVGATLANLLALHGLSVLVLEREPDIYRLPRAIQFDGECMRVFQTIGIADLLLPDLVVAPGMKFVDADGRLLLDWQRSTEVGPQGWHASYRFHQPTLETELRARLAEQPCVDVRLRHEVFALEPGDDDVGLRLEDMSGGRLLSTRARYVVGCDGARSTVRRFMGTELDDLRSHERWLVVDIILRKERADLGDHAVQYCDPARPATYVRGPGARRRWEFMLMPGEDASVMSRPEMIWQLLSRWVTPEDADLERPAVYTFHSVVAKGWRNGRLLIAGDAAHQTPPFMGQGMAAGIRDASNLAWKLAEVISGRAADDLLDTYETERSPHVREFIETAVRLGAVIQTQDPEEARRRDLEMRANPQVFTTPQPRLGPGVHEGGGAAGMVGEQPTLSAGIRLDSLAGYQFALLVDPTWEIAEAPSAVKVLAADSSAARDWLQRLGAGAVLLRPDRYVAALAFERQDITHLLGMATGFASQLATT